MTFVEIELTLPTRRSDDLRRANHARLLASAESTSNRALATIAGAWLIQLGQRLEAVRAARPRSRPITLLADLCGGCAN